MRIRDQIDTGLSANSSFQYQMPPTSPKSYVQGIEFGDFVI